VESKNCNLYAANMIFDEYWAMTASSTELIEQ
jgi:hypothetical protein